MPEKKNDDLTKKVTLDDIERIEGESDGPKKGRLLDGDDPKGTGRLHDDGDSPKKDGDSPKKDGARDDGDSPKKDGARRDDRDSPKKDGARRDDGDSPKKDGDRAASAPEEGRLLDGEPKGKPRDD